MTVVRVGTISGRHLIPVDLYLVEEEVRPGQDAYRRAYEAAQNHGATLGPGNEVYLYYSGLTEATLGAIDGYESKGKNVIPFRYDTPSGQYSPIYRGVSRFFRCGLHAHRSDKFCPTCGNQLYS